MVGLTGTPKVWRLTRAGTVEPNAMTTAQRAATFAASAPAGTVLMTRRDADGLHHYLILPDGSRDMSATFLPLAQAVAARAEPVENPGELFATPTLVTATANLKSPVGRSSQMGADITEMSRLLATTLHDGQWVAAVIRPATSRERNWHKEWIEHHLSNGSRTHHTLEQGAVVMSLWAGAESKAAGETILNQTTAAMPGFDMYIDPVKVSVRGKGALTILGGAAALILGTWLASVPWVREHSLVYLLAGMLAGAGLPVVAGGILYLFGRIPSYAEKARRFARNNLLVPAGRRVLWLARPKKATKDSNGAEVAARDGSYPLKLNGFMAGPALPVGLIAPHAGADSGVSQTAMRSAPALMRAPIGPYVGQSLDQPVHLSAIDLYAGVMAFGKAGSGKSRLIQSLFAWCSLERVRPSGRPGFPGKNNTLIVFENKGDGANDSEQWAKDMRDFAYRVDLAGASPLQVDILNVPGSAETKARAVVNALKYTFSDGSIQERSFDTLVQVLTASFVVNPPMALAAEVEPSRSPFYYASVLLGSRGDDAGVKLAGVIRSEAARVHATESTDLGSAAAMLQVLYEGKSVSQRAALTDAPRNKVSALLGSRYWDRPQRANWDRILTGKASIIINAGLSADGVLLDDELSRQMQSMLMYTLYEAIKRNCAGWYEAGQAVTIFADELSVLAGSSATVLTWLREQGRSYGVRAVFATQNPMQLSQEVRTSVMGYGTLLAFSQDNSDVVRALVADLNLGGDEWTGADVANLPQYEAVVRATAQGIRQTPFTLKIPNFWGERDSFARWQGYEQ